jgi:hypothetical protein
LPAITQQRSIEDSLPLLSLSAYRVFVDQPLYISDSLSQAPTFPLYFTLFLDFSLSISLSWFLTKVKEGNRKKGEGQFCERGDGEDERKKEKK